jgi:hypothetical protein
LTNQETLIIVLIAVGGVFGPWAIIVFALMKQSNEVYKVLKEPHTYYSKWYRVFLSVDSCFAFMMTFLAGILFSILLNLNVYPSDGDWRSYTLISVLVLLSAFTAIYIHVLNINHWKNLRNLAITFDPEFRRLWIEKDGQEYFIEENSILDVEIFSTGNYKMPFEYYKLNLADGRSLYLAGKGKGVSAIFEYFKKIHAKHIRRRLPLIPDVG